MSTLCALLGSASIAFGVVFSAVVLSGVATHLALRTLRRRRRIRARLDAIAQGDA